MQMLLKSPEGRIFERDLTVSQFRDYKAKGYTRPNREERLKYIEEKEKEHDIYVKDKGYADIYYMAPTANSDGYGNSSRYIKRRLLEYKIYLNENYNNQKVGFCYHLPNTLSLVHTPIKISYTMFESTQYPKFWEPWLKKADLVMVPSQFCADVMCDNFGIRPEVVPLGIEPEFFYHVERERSPDHVFTFLHYDAFKWRKGWDLLFTAFNEEFQERGGDPVKLILKSTLGITPPLSEYPKIEKISGRLDHSELIGILQRSDAFVFPTRGEGFGLTPLEAVATGIPAIVPNHSGITHYFDPRYFYDLETQQVEAVYDNKELRNLELGYYWEPTIKSLRERMRQVYNEWREGKIQKKSREMSEYANRYTMASTAEKIAQILSRYI